MPKQIAELDSAELSQLGLRLTAAEVWNPDDFGLMAAIVNFGGCSAGFVSEQGLIATNHHCAYGAIQANSSVEHDYLTLGFVAPQLGDELRAKGKTVKLLEKITDVTAEIRAATKGIDDPAARKRAFDLARKTLVQACEKTAHRSCQVAEFYNGSEVQLHEYLELSDIRLVYAPPSGVGNFGGEVDNWMWPRHSGDFSLVRAYVGPDGAPAEYDEANVPYRPKRFLKVGTQGVRPGSFVAVLGFPGHTDRYLPAAEMRRRLEQFLPSRVALYGEWIDILTEEGSRDPAVKIKVASKLRGLANRHKNARGMLEGIARDKLLERREAEELALTQWADRADASYAQVVPGLARLAQARRARFDRDFVVRNSSGSAGSLATAIDLVRRARERSKPDLERAPAYMDRNNARLWTRIKRRLRDYDATVDQRLLEALIRRADALPAAAQLPGLRGADIAAYLRRTQINNEAFVRGLFDTPDQATIDASEDPMLVLARELVVDIEALEEHEAQQAGEMLALGPKYFEMLRAVRKGPVYPDANSTLRFSYATVKGYAPRDGLEATPQSRVAGQVAKHTGEAPFALPSKLLQAASTSKDSVWADPALGDVPVCFLATGDTTGGNSGSPMVDGDGRWVGLNFDRVWENIAGDFGYDMSRSRNIAVDVRYLLWSLDAVDNATRLLAEMGLANGPAAGAGPPQGAASARPEPAGLEFGTPLAQPASPQAGAPLGNPPTGCGCGTAPRSAHWAFALMGLLGLRRRKSQRSTRRRGR